MSVSFSVSASTGVYEVEIGAGVSLQGFADAGHVQVIADEFFRSRLGALGEKAIFVAASELEKSLDRTPALIERLRATGVNRQSVLIAVGGGIIQDLSAFVASVYMRGVPWRYVPTTVLAMVDSCIGGKSSINVGPYKNLVGTFHPPQRIYVDPALAQTLPQDQFASGLIEAAKICFCRGDEAFARYLSYTPSPAMGTVELEGMIEVSLQAKRHFIEVDEFDREERLLLNFGHTFGHALEGASGYAIPHGIAVGVGIVCALEFQRLGGMSYAAAATVGTLEAHLRKLAGAQPNLREQLRALDLDYVLERFDSDKKHTSERYTLILVAADGKVVLERLVRSAAVRARIRQSLQATIESYTT